MYQRLRSELLDFVEKSAPQSEEFVAGQTKIPLSAPTYGPEEILEVMDSLLTYKVTMGEKVRRFEELFSQYIGTRNAIMVNSGSSANLVALSVLGSRSLRKRIKPGDEVITPAVTWSTTVFPIANIGAVPVLVDVNLTDFTMDISAARKALTRKTKAILPVHLLGSPCDMEQIGAIAKQHDIYLVEDACEAHGAEIRGRKVGSFGDLATFSFFFSHHISTIEGGMVMTNSDAYADMARSLRAHGWIRERTDRNRIAALYPSLDSRFLFVSTGYNLRPTEIQGAFGIHQISKLEQFIRARIENAEYWTRELKKFPNYFLLPETSAGTRRVFFGYPVTVTTRAPFTREELVRFLEEKGIETRPIMTGDVTQQPAITGFRHRVAGRLTNSRIIHSQSFLWGNHQGIGPPQRQFIVDCIHEFVEQRSDKSKG